MKAHEANLLQFMKVTHQFVVPIYQRTYSWTREECLQLCNDIVKAAMDDQIQGHFIGSIVYIEDGIHTQTEVPQLLVIDGQQRLTTLTLLLAAIAKRLGDTSVGDLTRKKVQNYYLFNSEETGDLHFKLTDLGARN